MRRRIDVDVTDKIYLGDDRRVSSERRRYRQATGQSYYDYTAGD